MKIKWNLIAPIAVILGLVVLSWLARHPLSRLLPIHHTGTVMRIAKFNKGGISRKAEETRQLTQFAIFFEDGFQCEGTDTSLAAVREGDVIEIRAYHDVAGWPILNPEWWECDEAQLNELMKPAERPGHAKPERQRPTVAAPTAHIIHTEFQSTDAAATTDFLAAMFDIPATESTTPISGPLYEFTVSEEDSLLVRTAAAHEAGAGTTVYFETDDLDDSLAEAVGHGATVVVPKMTFGGKGHIGWVEAPGGVYMAFLERSAEVDTTGDAAD